MGLHDLLLLAGTLPAALVAQPMAQPSAARQSFDRLSSLVGTWSGSYANGRRHGVTYRPSALGTALVETWALGPDRESITIYYLDGDRLLATHFCPQGNQPRLALVRAVGDRFDFDLVDGTNLGIAGRSHQHSFTIWLHGSDRYDRSEHYVENGTPPSRPGGAEDEVVVYRRAAAQ